MRRSLPLKLLQAREAVMGHFRPHLNAHGITEQQWRVLRALAERRRMDAGELARLVTLRMPSLSRIMVDMERRALVTKRRSNADRRLVDLEITEEGLTLFSEMAAESERIYAELEKRLGQDGYARLMQVLDDAVDRLDTGDV